MPRKPLATGLVLAVVLLTVAACSSGDDSPSPGDKSSDSTATNGTDGPDTKLVRQNGKGDIKNVIVKTDSGGKVSLSAKAPGHEVMTQVYDPDTKTWSEPKSVFEDDTRFCHAIKAKHKGATIAATVTCSISAKDTDGTQSSYVLASTDGETWKRLDLPGASGKPILSPIGNAVAWSSPTSFLLWNAKTGTFKAVKYTQSEDAPAIGVMQNNGVLLIIKATPGKKDACTFTFQGASASAPAPKLISSIPQSGHPKCAATSAKFQGSDIIANFDSTSTTKDDNGKKVTETTTFAVAFTRGPTGKWVIKV